MKRRDFLKRAIPVTAIPFSVNGPPLHAFERFPMAGASASASDSIAGDRALVVIQLNGGNDGINTVVSLDQYSSYRNLRPNIAIPDDRVLRLTEATGLHPAMTGLKALYDMGRLCVVQGVSYPNPNFSHFRATDIWLTAADYNQYLTTGWLGRYLELEFQDYPDGYPNPMMPDPLAIQIGSVVSVGLQGSTGSMAITITDPATFYRLVSGTSSGGQDTPPQTPAGRELQFIRQIANQSAQYASRVKEAAEKAQNRSALYPAAGKSSLADQLKIVARLIAGGLRTRIYFVSTGGFDTHSSQVVATDTTTGTHANLLGNLSTAIRAFQDDIELLGAGHRVVAMTFTEFGRRAASNSSLGTDHGTATPVFIVGAPVRAGIVGANPSLTDLSSGNLKMQFDFRAIYASVLRQWLGMDDSKLAVIFSRSYPILDLIWGPPLLPRRRPVVVDSY